MKVRQSKETDAVAVEKDLENGIGKTEKAKVGTADFLLEIENRRSIKVCASFMLNQSFPRCFFLPSISIFVKYMWG